jgi:hypothetical protein
MLKNFWIIVLVIALAIFVVTIVPLILLVGLNYMGYNIPYTFDSWLGAFFIQVFIGLSTNLKVEKKK